ncbi:MULTISPECIES: type I glutamate--ammonia ligase [Actinomycetes]|uniref:Glutamine synthetase n=2 Tax=Actinomycetes TaxID=1760 RepID=A0ABP6LNU3_9MICC|nr:MULTISPECIES: type I glutamate--ammonia ligase [unclassified Nesterenkonia]MDS2172009.1 type I glutamate--ammonia ligase [Nesterenkonia sp. CL21]OSM43902.1 type I glutamate--ammonia ligase [Nesterenkonia sp. PF2B19]
MDRQQEFVLRTIEERDVRFVRLWFTDVVGALKSVALAPAEVEGVFSEGLGFDGSSIEGLSRVFESDMLLKPDPSSFQILPWRGEDEPTSRMFCDILTPDQEPAAADPRSVLRRQLDTAAEMGFTCYTHPEIEFYLLDSDEVDADGYPVPVDRAGYFDHVTGSVSQDFRRHVVSMLEAVGISVEFSHHEAGPGQNEIDLRYADALTTADNIMTFRTVIKEVAVMQGKYATFMPKPFAEHPGSGMHTHFGLFEGDTNAFFAPNAEFNLSTIARQFIAGVLTHAPEFTAVTNQFVNSYKRLWGGGEAPSHVSWGHNNRSALMRVPLYKPTKGGSARVEFRGIDSSANPYLAYAVVLGAGLKGIQEEYQLAEAITEDVWSLTTPERKALGIKPLPGTLHDAIRQMEDSELVAEILGEQVFENFLRNKQQEWDEYRINVSPFEINRYLGMI